MQKDEQYMDAAYWDQRWVKGQTGWDMGSVSQPLKEYIDQLKNKDLRILIPGCGNAYEAEYLWKNGFKNTYIVEISEKAVESFLNRYPDFPYDHIFVEDFFTMEQGQFDLVIEQTFFCAFEPERRDEYVAKMAEIIKPGGKLAGVFFNCELDGGPPFGGNIDEYRKRFSEKFDLQVLEPCHNSIKPREGREAFMVAVCK